MFRPSSNFIKTPQALDQHHRGLGNDSDVFAANYQQDGAMKEKKNSSKTPGNASMVNPPRIECSLGAQIRPARELYRIACIVRQTFSWSLWSVRRSGERYTTN